MTRPIILCAAVAMAFAAVPAVAGDQLSRALGVAPGTLTTAELILLRQAREDNDHQRIRMILEGRQGANTPSTTNPGAVQLARSLGMPPGTYSVADLRRIRQATEDGDDGLRRAIERRAIGRPMSNTSDGHRTLARALGVDPNDYTTAELSYMYIDAHD